MSHILQVLYQIGPNVVFIKSKLLKMIMNRNMQFKKSM
jgi:hypothetical protein